MKFDNLFPNTKKELDKAVGDVFPHYSVCIYTEKENFTAQSENVDSKTLFDLASLTKVLCTTTLYLLAEEKGILSIDEPVQSYFGGVPKRIKISHLLNHSSGLPAWLNLHGKFHETNSRGHYDPVLTPSEAKVFYEKEILQNFTDEKIGKQILYSDLGFMLLGWILEKKTNSLLDALFQEWIAHPLKLKRLQFLPTTPNVAPTENCPWRNHILTGEVHDDNCYVLGGVAGHAGLFGTSDEVADLARCWLDPWLYELKKTKHKKFFLNSKRVLHYLSFSHLMGSARALGWDGIERSENQVSSAGQYLSHSSKGHLGFTGTSLWIDPEHEFISVLLTNRVCPTRENEKIRAFRPLFHDTLFLEWKKRHD